MEVKPPLWTHFKISEHHEHSDDKALLGLGPVKATVKEFTQFAIWLLVRNSYINPFASHRLPGNDVYAKDTPQQLKDEIYTTQAGWLLSRCNL